MTVVIINAWGDEIEAIREWRRNRREEWGGARGDFPITDWIGGAKHDAKPCQFYVGFPLS